MPYIPYVLRKLRSSKFSTLRKVQFNKFLLRLQAQTGVHLVPGKPVIVFDGTQLVPRVRQAIKYLVKDGRFDYAVRPLKPLRVL